MVYKVLVTSIDDNIIEFSVLTNRKHSYNDIESLVRDNVPDYDEDNYYFKYDEL